MNDPALKSLLNWGLENSEASRNDPNATKGPSSKIDSEALRSLLGAPPTSDAQLMVDAMAIIENVENTAGHRADAFEGFEELIASIDNANNIGPLKLWEPLVAQLGDEDAKIRKFAASSCGTAAENNLAAQEKLLILGAIPTLTKLATVDPDVDVRKKANRALSSAVRNYQPSLDVAVENVPSKYKPKAKLNAGDMESVDSFIHPIRADVVPTP